MNILKFNIVILFLGIGLFGYGQQQKNFPNYHYYNPYAINSANSGLIKSPQLFLGSEISTMNVEGKPSTFYMSGIWTFNTKNFAVGMSYLNDKVGVFSDNLLKVSYAYRLEFDKRNVSNNRLYEHSLSFAIDAGLRFIQDDLLSLEMTSDPKLAENQSQTIPVFGASAMYNHPDFFVGLSMDNLINLSKKDELDQPEIAQEKPLYFYGGYRFWAMRDRLLLTPNLLIRHNFETPMIIDYNLKFDYNDMFLASVGYRDLGAVNFSFGVKLFEKKLDVLCMTNIYTKSNFFGNLFGLMLKYNINSFIHK